MSKDRLDQMLRDSLRAVDRTSEPIRSERQTKARIKLKKRLRRRRMMVAGYALAGTAALVVVAIASSYLWSRTSNRADVSNIAGGAGAIVRSIHTDPAPRDVGIRGDRVWVTTAEGVEEFSRTSGDVLKSISLRGGADDLDLTQADVWISNPRLGVVQRILSGSNRVKTIRVAPGPVRSLEITARPEALWALIDDAKLVRVDLVTGKRTVVQGIDKPLDVAGHDRKLWVLTASGVQQLDPATGRTKGALVPTSLPSGDLYQSGHRLLLASRATNTIVSFSAASGNTSGVFDITGRYSDLTSSGRILWVLSSTGKESSLLTPVLSATFQEAAAPLHLTGDPVGVANSYDSIWVLERGDRLLELSKASFFGS